MAAGRVIGIALAGAVGLAAVAALSGDRSLSAAPQARPSLHIATPNLPNGVVVGPTAAGEGQAAGAAATDNMFTYDYGNFRDGVEPGGPSLLKIGQHPAWDRNLGGAMYGSPLVDGSLVVAADEKDDVYGLNAANGSIKWHVPIGTTVQQSTIDSAPGVSCGDIDPLGITGTPVIDPKLGEIFVSGEIQRPANPLWKGIEHVTAAISLTGKLLWERQIDPPGAGSIYQIPAEQQRPAITLANGRLYTNFGGLAGDCGPYQGYVVSIPESGKGALTHFKVPTSREGAIWAVGGASVTTNGELFVATGNSANGPGQKFDYGDAVIGLSPALRMQGYFAPTDWAQLNSMDLDLGSDGPTVLPGGTLIFETGKHSIFSNNEDLGYLLAPGRLGGIRGSLFNAAVCPNGDGAFGANAAAVVKVKGADVLYVYVPCQSGTVAIIVDRSKPSFKVAWQSHGGSPNGPPIVAGGLVWALNWNNGTLYGMANTTGQVLVTRSVDPVDHFAAPSAGDGMLFIPTQNGVEAFRPA
jgi:outer membrane protein assembly factor BamB